MKKLLYLIGFIIIVSLIIINNRTPFFKQNSGPWSIGFGKSKSFPNKIQFEKNTIFSLEKLRSLHADTEFLADPFFLKVKDTFYLFFEHKPIGHKANIGLLTSVDGKNYQFKGTVLNEVFHLSYPHVFIHKNEFYMLPESGDANAVLLYKAQHFPYDWKVCDTLINNVKYKDPTLFLSDTLNIMAVYDNKLNLLLYQADSLHGKWKPHAQPIVNMGSESRPGGRFIADGKGLLLPVQNSSNGYGYGLSLYRMTFKNNTYKVKREKPYFLKSQKEIKEFTAGMHHFDIQKTDGDYYFVYDGNRLTDNSKKWNCIGALKITYYDIKNWFLHHL